MNMSKDDAKAFIKSHPELYLQRDDSGKGYICPNCGSGTGPKGTGITPPKDDPEHFTCWAGCFTHADIIDIVGIVEGLTDYPAKLEAAARAYGIEITQGERWQPPPRSREPHKAPAAPPEPRQAEADPPADEQQPDLTEAIQRAHEAIGQTDYPQRRGLSEATINRFQIGYADRWTYGTGRTPWRALIIPTGGGSLVARNIDPNAPADQRYRKSGKARPLNLDALDGDKPVYIVEGEIDALSIVEAGGEAVGLGSLMNLQGFLSGLKTPPRAPLVLALDRDEQGQAESHKEAYRAAMKSLGLPALVTDDLYGQHKDANEALMADREGLASRLLKSREAWAEAVRADYANRASNAAHLAAFVDGIAASVNTPSMPTGFSELDRILDGGLYEGLYVVGAISSLGKTTFVLQMADQLAQDGHDVLIFSLEMARYELMAKSISRHTLLRSLSMGAGSNYATVTRGITDGKRYSHYRGQRQAGDPYHSRQQEDVIADAVMDYGSYSSRVYIVEGERNVGVTQIRQHVDAHISATGRAPVVVIDYLQMLEPSNDRATEKQTMDSAVKGLKILSRDHKLPVICISSFNRDNYFTRVSMQAFKESGGIEYSADVLIGLQLEGVTKENIDELKKAQPRKIEAVVLKNRNGRSGDGISYSFYAPFNLFVEMGLSDPHGQHVAQAAPVQRSRGRRNPSEPDDA